MTLPPVIRIFFAIDLSDETKKTLGSFITSLKRQSRTNSIRWTKPENLHITLQFLGKINTAHITNLLAEVRARIEGIREAFLISLGSLQLYPSPYRPRVIVLEVDHQNELAHLSSLIGEGIKALDYEIESRPFKAHLTLGRIKQPQGINLNFLSEIKLPQFEQMKIKEVVLFRSEPQPEGSQYMAIEKILLTKTKEKKAG